MIEEKPKICSLNVVPVDDVLESFKEIMKEEMKELFLSMTENQPLQHGKEETELFTRAETAGLLRVSLVTLDSWTKIGLIKAQRIGTRKRYTKEAIEAALKNVANKTRI